MEIKDKASLMDAREMNARHPSTFYAPSAVEIEGIQVGYFVKAGFMTDPTFRINCERMWCIVKEISGVPGAREYVAELNNDPVVVPMVCGETVYLDERHILDILAPGSV